MRAVRMELYLQPVLAAMRLIAMTTMLRRSDNGSSDSLNFCIVVNTMPFACRLFSSSMRFSRLAAC